MCAINRIKQTAIIWTTVREVKSMKSAYKRAARDPNLIFLPAIVIDFIGEFVLCSMWC